jgi:sec-independent protein translocase protein TatA
MFGLGHTELIVIGVIVFLIFGAKRIPEIGKGLGGAIREFRSIKKEVDLNETDDNQDLARSETEGEKKETPTLESKVTDKVIEQVPGVKKAVEVKKKADAVKKLLQ